MYEYLYRLGSTTQNQKWNDQEKWIVVNIQNNLKCLIGICEMFRAFGNDRCDRVRAW